MTNDPYLFKEDIKTRLITTLANVRRQWKLVEPLTIVEEARLQGQIQAYNNAILACEEVYEEYMND